MELETSLSHKHVTRLPCKSFVTFNVKMDKLEYSSVAPEYSIKNWLRFVTLWSPMYQLITRTAEEDEAVMEQRRLVTLFSGTDRVDGGSDTAGRILLPPSSRNGMPGASVTAAVAVSRDAAGRKEKRLTSFGE